MTRHATRTRHQAGLALLAAGATVAALLAGPPTAGATAALPPTQPGAITVTGVTINSASLSWKASADTLGIEGYQIYRATGSTPVLIATTDGGIARYSARNLYASTAYTFSVVATDSAGQSSAPQTTTFTTPANPNTTPPNPPSAASVAAKAFSDTRIDVVWAASPPTAPATTTDVSGYLILRDGVLAGRVDLPGGLRYSDNGLTPSTHYIYTIEAVDSAGNVSAPTVAKLPAGATTLATGTVQIARGPFVSNVTGSTAVISWFTNIPTAGTVHYGVASTTEHSANDSAGSHQQHAVAITGLTPTTTYRYTVGDGTVASATATLRTAAAPGTPFSFAAIGDFGGASPGEAQNAANIAKAGTSFIQTLGDNIYPSAGQSDPDFSTVYSDFDARFFKQFGPALANQAFFPANGNQEYYSDGKFWTTFPMPGSNHAWYSYNWGNAHILVLDTEQPFTPGSAEYAFVESDLAANQSQTWRIVAMQRPPFSSVSANSSSKNAAKYLVPLFEKYHVALVLSGNSHNYERSFPLTAGVPAPGGITYVVSGGGGNGHNPFAIPQPSWSAHRDATSYEYARVSVSPTALTVDEIESVTAKVIDTTTIGTPIRVPAAPTSVTAVRGNSSATVRWAAPVDNGGSAITGYVITPARNGVRQSAIRVGAGLAKVVTGLTNGAQYTFTVQAVNAKGTGASSAASRAIVLLVPTRSTIWSAPSRTTYAAVVRVIGRLTRTDTGAPVAGQVVTLQYRRLGSRGAYRSFAAARSASNGFVTYRTFRPGYSVQVRLVHPTAGVYLGSVSTSKAVSCQMRLSLRTSATRIRKGRAVTLHGTVSPRAARKVIYLQRWLRSRWVYAGRKLVSSSSRYSFTIRAGSRGTRTYRVAMKATYKFRASGSAAKKVKTV